MELSPVFDFQDVIYYYICSCIIQYIYLVVRLTLAVTERRVI